MYTITELLYSIYSSLNYMNIFIINILEFNLEKNIVKVIIILSFAM